MTYPNALAGVKKIYSANILSLIAVIVSFVATVIALVVLKVDPNNISTIAPTEQNRTILALLGLVILISLILGIIATIREMIGLHQAGKDQSYFKLAFWISIIVLLASFGVSLFTSLRQPALTDAAARTAQSSPLSSVLNVVSNAADTLVTVLSILGLGALAKSLEDADVSRRAKSAYNLVLTLLLLALAANVIALIFGLKNDTSQVLLGVLALVVTVLSLISYIVYLVLLKKSIRMLENK